MFLFAIDKARTVWGRASEKASALAAAALLTAGLVAATPARAVPVDLELVLAVDVSGSVNTAEFQLQQSGYSNAFRSSEVINAITSGTIGSIAVALVYWSGVGEQTTAVDFTLIDDAASAAAFADAIDAAARPYSGQTNIVGALNYAAGLFSNNGFEGRQNTIDLSGDGTESEACLFFLSTCAPLQAARDAALAGDVDVINAIAIDGPDFFGDGQLYFENNVIGGPGAFAMTVSNFNDFGAAIKTKILNEIGTSVAEPETFALFAMAMGGLLLTRRRRP